jgi:hypothetical protein
MGLFGTKEESPLYHVNTARSSGILKNATDAQLEKWGSDPNCVEHEACADYLAKRLADRAAAEAAKTSARAAKREELQDNPFDPRTEVSADAERIVKQASVDAEHIAGRIVKHLWIIFVLLPIVIGILFELLK